MKSRVEVNASRVDICLLLEGTYPYVKGGVSSWVHQIISGLPQFNFYVAFIGGHSSAYGSPCYSLPPNVVGFDSFYLMGSAVTGKPSARNGNRQQFDIWEKFISYFSQSEQPIPGSLLEDIVEGLGRSGLLRLSDFLYSRSSWQVLLRHYCKFSRHQSFVDYFWTYRNLYQPMFELVRIVQKLPRAQVYHSISTGYGGFLGAMCKRKFRQPFLISEHGIYTKERKIDLSHASWISEQSNLLDTSMHKEMNLTRQTWIRFFEQMGLTGYTQADEIVALFEGNRLRQLKDGASAEKTQVIRNGINIKRFDHAFARRPLSPPKVVGLVGRVVPIKDIKTFVRTIQGVLMEEPDLEGWVIGPTDEDKSYVHECRLLIESLGLQDRVKLLGNQNVAEILPKLGVVMLTSISEAQPLVLLEAMAAGIPVIATEVGACKEIVYGAEGEDAQLGAAGKVIPIANPAAGVEAISSVLTDAKVWLKAGDTGRRRVKKYYDEQLLFRLYTELYQGAIHGGDRL